MKKFQKILDAIRIGLQLAQMVEAAIPGKGVGKQRLSFVIGSIGDVMGSIDEVTPIVEKVIGRFVTAANETGTFPVEPVETPK